MGALDIAPTLHFVEQVNGEEWIKVMDEYLVPNCLGVSFCCSWTTRRRARAGRHLTTTRQC